MTKKNEPKSPETASQASEAVEKSLVEKTDNVPAVHKANGLGGKRGFENLEARDLLLPRIKLLQALSPEVMAAGSTQRAGEMYLGLSNYSYGGVAVVTPILHFRSRIKWTPRSDGGGIDCSSPDARAPREKKYAANCALCQHQLWNENAKTDKEKQPLCTLYENFLVLIGDANEPVIVPFERTKLKTAKAWYSAGARKPGDMWDYQYELKVNLEKSKKGDPFFNYSVRDLNQKTPDDRRKVCEGLWESLSGKTISETNTEDDAASDHSETTAAY